VLLRDIHSKLLTQYDCKEVCAPSQSQVHVGASARLSSQDGISQQQEAAPLSIPQLNRLFEASVAGYMLSSGVSASSRKEHLFLGRRARVCQQVFETFALAQQVESTRTVHKASKTQDGCLRASVNVCPSLPYCVQEARIKRGEWGSGEVRGVGVCVWEHVASERRLPKSRCSLPVCQEVQEKSICFWAGERECVSKFSKPLHEHSK
jgi:hypothetical protein